MAAFMKKHDRQASRPSKRPLPHPKKSLGQNFLVNQSIALRIVEALRPRENETILEIGPGRGILTARLLERAGTVVAVELDRDLVQLLTTTFEGSARLLLIHADAVEADFCKLIHPSQTARVVANLPYYVATALLRRMLDHRRCITEMLVMLQSEVVDRIMAPPSTPARGFLSVFVQAYCSMERLFDVSPGSFSPPPKVSSAVVRLSIQPGIIDSVADQAAFWSLVGSGFAHRRKTIANNLKAASQPLKSVLDTAGGIQPVLTSAGLDPRRRAETLSLEEWLALWKASQPGQRLSL
jgi:16S rRNA (adenine1518-N6/adenine1519-N6)-dimethyltransferase